MTAFKRAYFIGQEVCPHELLTNRLRALKISASLAFWPGSAAETRLGEFEMSRSCQFWEP